MHAFDIFTCKNCLRHLPLHSLVAVRSGGQFLYYECLSETNCKSFQTTGTRESENVCISSTDSESDPEEDQEPENFLTLYLDKVKTLMLRSEYNRLQNKKVKLD